MAVISVATSKPPSTARTARIGGWCRKRSGKRQCVVVIRQRNGRTLPAAFPSGADAETSMRNRVARETQIMADEATLWNGLKSRCVIKRINHQVAYSADGACTNGAGSFFSRMRWARG